MKQQTQLRARYLQTLKHSDTEETIDLWFYRPIGFCVALVGEKFGWTPNAITIFGIFLGIGSGLLLLPHNLWLNLLGFALLVMADVCDSADGQLARMTKQYSRLGRILDGVSSDVWFASIYICIAIRYAPEWGWKIWALASCAGACHALQACMSDHYRQMHLFFANIAGNAYVPLDTTSGGGAVNELDSSEDMKKEFAQISFAKEPVRKISIYFYKNYTLLQETLNPTLTAFRRRFCQNHKLLMPEFCEFMRRRTFPFMKWTNVLTYNWRAITLFVSILLGTPWYYLACEVTIFNLILIYMMIGFNRQFR